MFQSYYPDHLNNKLLDTLLAKGWFRGGNVMYQSKMLCLDNGVYSVVNIRSNLSNHQFSKSLRKLLNRNKKRFSYKVQPLRITTAKAQLYKNQSKKFKGFVHSSLENYLFEGMPINKFNTYEINVYDGDRLVAASFFDLGENSIASLLGVYDEAYKKCSLGIFTMLLEVEFAKEMGYQYYYPGYVFRYSSMFDYKLRIGEIEYYNWKEEWMKLDNIEKSSFPADQLNNAFSNLETQLVNSGISFRKYLYPYFSLGYSQQFELDFLYSIQFLQLSELNVFGVMVIVIYDIKEDFYTLLQVKDRNDLNLVGNSNFSDDIKDSEVYFQKILSIEQVLFSSRNLEDLVNFLKT